MLGLGLVGGIYVLFRFTLARLTPLEPGHLDRLHQPQLLAGLGLRGSLPIDKIKMGLTTCPVPHESVGHRILGWDLRFLSRLRFNKLKQFLHLIPLDPELGLLHLLDLLEIQDWKGGLYDPRYLLLSIPLLDHWKEVQIHMLIPMVGSCQHCWEQDLLHWDGC